MNQQEPAWKDKIDRWYQLDQISMSLCQAVYLWNLEWQKNKSRPEFDQIIFICQGASNSADADFVASGALSPSKFVYTLPNIGPSVAIQLLEWRGPVYCFNSQNAVKMALDFAQLSKGQKNLKTLIIQCFESLNQAGYRDVTKLLV